MTTVTETFFLPEEAARVAWKVPADIYNLDHSLLVRNEQGNAFIPIRSMQYMAVLDKNEIVFIDSQSYAVSNGEGGRLILIAWQFPHSHDRDSLDEPMQCEVVYYQQRKDDIQLRLVSEFRQALTLFDSRKRNNEIPSKGAKIIVL